MPPSSTFPLADRIMGGTLAEYLRDARDRGDSFEAITFALRNDHDLTVSTATIRRWFDALPPVPEAEPAEAVG